MSFAKANIRRFNETTTCAPAPGTYNPEVSSKSVGPIINKSERFNTKGRVIHSSSESLNSYDGDHDRFVFKTPKPCPKYEATIEFSQKKNRVESDRKKSVSMETLFRRSDVSRVEALKRELAAMEEELSATRLQNERLSYELKAAHKLEPTDADCMLITLDNQMTLNANLRYKCDALLRIADSECASCAKFYSFTLELLEHYINEEKHADAAVGNIIARYEQLVVEYRSDFEALLTFFEGISHRLDSVHDFEVEPAIEELKRRLTDAEKRRYLYEVGANETRQLIDELLIRVKESDTEVERLMGVVEKLECTEKLDKSELSSKEEQLSILRRMLETEAREMIDEVQSTESDLLQLVDALKAKVARQRETYENQLAAAEATAIASAKDRDAARLALQEAEDRVVTLECKWEMAEKVIEQMRMEGFCKMAEKSVSCGSKTIPNSETMQRYLQMVIDFYREVVNSVSSFKAIGLSEKDVQTVTNFVDDVSREEIDFDHLIQILTTLHLVVIKMFACAGKISAEMTELKSSFCKLHDEFAQKCDDCVQLTRLLKVLEARLERTVKSGEQKDEDAIAELGNQIEWLGVEKHMMEDELKGVTKQLKEEQSLLKSIKENLKNTELEKESYKLRVQSLEEELSVEREKNNELENRNFDLTKLIGPYRLYLEQYEDEMRCMSAKNETDEMTVENLFQKYADVLGQQSHKLKIKHIIKLKNDLMQMKKKNDLLQLEVNKFMKSTTKKKIGKENRILSENQNSSSKQPICHSFNSTYVLSPKNM